MKKLIAIALLLCGHCQANYNGFYAGLKVGGERAIANGHTSNFLGLIDIFDNTTTISNRGETDGHNDIVIGNFYAGYGFTCYGVFLGLEGFVNFPRHEIRKNNVLESTLDFADESESVHIHQILDHCFKVTSRCVEYGVDFKPGFLITPCTLLYGRVGAAFNSFAICSRSELLYEDDSKGLVEPPSVSVMERFLSNKQHSMTGLRLGVGAELQVYENFGITLDYVFTEYGSVCIEGQHDTTIRGKTLPDGLNVNSQAHLRNNAVLIGVSYRFCLSSLLGWCWR